MSTASRGATHSTVDVPAGLQPAFLAVNTVTNKIYVAGGQANGDLTVIDGEPEARRTSPFHSARGACGA